MGFCGLGIPSGVTEMMFSDMALSEIGTSFGHLDREDDNPWELVVPICFDTHL